VEVLKRWTRLVKGLQIRRRLQAQYPAGTDTGTHLLDGRDVNVEGKSTSEPRIRRRSIDTVPESGSVLQDAVMSEAGRLGKTVGMFLRSVCRVN